MTVDFERYTAIFAALSETTRLQMLQAIDDAGEMPCTELIEVLGVAKSMVSYHIKILVHAKLISVRKQGRNYFYTSRRDVLDEVIPGFRSRLSLNNGLSCDEPASSSEDNQAAAA